MLLKPNKSLIVLGLGLSLMQLQGCSTETFFISTTLGLLGTGYYLSDERRPNARIKEDIGAQRVLMNTLAEYLKDRDDVQVDITVYNRTALIVGQVPDSKTAADIYRLAKQTYPITNVVDKTQLTKVNEQHSWVDDTNLKMRITSTLVKMAKLNSVNVKVVVWEGDVYLMGVLTAKEQKRVSDQTRFVEGVKSVTTLFDLWDDRQRVADNFSREATKDADQQPPSESPSPAAQPQPKTEEALPVN